MGYMARFLSSSNSQKRISWDEVSVRLKDVWLNDTKHYDKRKFLKYIGSIISKEKILLDCAKKYGTPQYVLDEDELRANSKDFLYSFKKYCDKTRMFYAFKCNDLPRIVSILKESGFNADVAGMFELRLAIQLGFDNIIFTSPGKSDEELLLAMNNPTVVIINIDNIQEMNRIIALYRKMPSYKNNCLRVSFRVNILGGKWSKFGMSLDELKSSVSIIKKSGFMKWSGIHFHSSWNDSPSKYLEGLELLYDYLPKNFDSQTLNELDFIDIGGGFVPEGRAPLFKDSNKGELMKLIMDEDADVRENMVLRSWFHEKISSVEEFSSTIGRLFDSLFIKKLGLRAELWIEPGRMIVSNSSHIILKVIAIKGQNIIVDGGVNMVGGYDFDNYAFPTINMSRPSKKYNNSIIYGPLCDPNDLWGYGYYGERAKVGDILVVMHQGAYTYATAWKFIKPISKYVGFKNNSVRLLKDEEQFEDRYRKCIF